MNIYYFTPYSLEKNLGKEYNKYIENVTNNDDDWICLTDADMMFLTPDYGTKIYEILYKNLDVGLFTCYTNRVGNIEQLYDKHFSRNDSLINHRKIASYAYEQYKDELKYINEPISGYFMLFSRKTWRQVGKFSEDLQILGVDNDFSSKILKLGKKIALMKGIYVLHYYRLMEGIKYRDHLR
jgi:GT2 family glycosyltransferase